MKFSLIAVGTRMPDWVERGIAEYSKRLPKEFSLTLKEIPLVRRSKNYNIEQCKDREAVAILAQVKKDDYIVALEVTGKNYSTEKLATLIDQLRSQGRNISLLVGGPDGLGAECLERADEQWSLSALTLPHPLVRIMLAEQLYRVWSLLSGHPYHRE